MADYQFSAWTLVRRLNVRRATVQRCRFSRTGRIKPTIISSLFFALITVMTAAAEEKPRPLLVFSAMGDVPYSPVEYLTLPKQIADLPKESTFVIHLGDIKAGAVPCTEIIYETVSKMLAESKCPLFIIPGDNEWNDCANPEDGWVLWLKYFNRIDEKWKKDFSVLRQETRDENFAFVHSQVLFIGINIVGGRVHDEAEWKKRHAQNLDWTIRNFERSRDSVRSAVIFGHALPTKVHDDYFQGLSDAAAKFDKPILYLHGDGHRWIHDRPFANKNILRIQVDQGAIAPPIKITVTDDPKEPFVVDRRKDHANAN